MPRRPLSCKSWLRWLLLLILSSMPGSSMPGSSMPGSSMPGPSRPRRTGRYAVRRRSCHPLVTCDLVRRVDSEGALEPGRRGYRFRRSIIVGRRS
ncbi:hypothetical protein B0T26DRAFT_304164 [Lasiosphaeria miniovina]|uniref:Secreted protein n=1 Tax=Lasiosphaeria miniovina TaxID=1954250 RepID=A0AA40DY02_9PEZI|nr:uncharacterized protein B0T26DRAFT_304164 [Lasiosphaeria miniovina]KAK0717817.1 hypothetical protein B0T26DRAFT_304164 [Lasiosphaeria miniovina]